MKSQCARILDRLRHGPATAAELYGLHCIVHSRIAELRKQGHVIVCTRTPGLSGPEAYSYRIVSGSLRERETDSPRHEASRTVGDPQADVAVGSSRSLSDPLTLSPLVPQPSRSSSLCASEETSLGSAALHPRPTSGEHPCAAPSPDDPPAGAAQLSLLEAAA